MNDSVRGDTLADIDEAIGSAVEGVARRYLPRDAAKAVRRELVGYLGDLLNAPLILPISADSTEDHSERAVGR